MHEVGGKILSGKIVEIEAYDGRTDEASHTYNGKTKRNEVMFKQGGHLYVYFTYGIHFCGNVVCEKEGVGAGLLMRGIEPLEGIEQMALNRFNKTEITEREKLNLTSGPGKIAQAFGFNREHNGKDLVNGNVYILDMPKLKKSDYAAVQRIGIKKSVDLPWRFYIKDNPYVSKK